LFRFIKLIRTSLYFPSTHGRRKRAIRFRQRHLYNCIIVRTTIKIIIITPRNRLNPFSTILVCFTIYDYHPKTVIIIIRFSRVIYGIYKMYVFLRDFLPGNRIWRFDEQTIYYTVYVGTMPPCILYTRFTSAIYEDDIFLPGFKKKAKSKTRARINWRIGGKIELDERKDETKGKKKTTQITRIFTNDLPFDVV